MIFLAVISYDLSNANLSQVTKLDVLLGAAHCELDRRVDGVDDFIKIR